MKVSNLIALLTNRSVQGNAYVKNGELYQGNTAQAILVKNQAELDEVKKHVAPGSIAYTAGYGSMWQLSAAGSWEEIQEEGGSGGGGLVIRQTVDVATGTMTMDKTWQEIFDAVQAGQYVCLLEVNGEQDAIQRAIVEAYVNPGEFDVGYREASDGSLVVYKADSADGYPVNDDSTPK